MSKKLVLYEIPQSPPVRAVKVLAKALNLELELKTVDLMNGDHLKEDFLKINPTHTVPTLDDNGVIIWDSHAIMSYLVDKYANNDQFYPKDLIKRSEINQLLYFDVSFLHKFAAIVKPMYYEGVKEIPKTHLENLEKSYDSLERILMGKKFLTGNNVTIADISVVATLSNTNLIIRCDEKYPNTSSWFKRMEGLPYYKPNADGLDALIKLIKEKDLPFNV